MSEYIEILTGNNCKSSSTLKSNKSRGFKYLKWKKVNVLNGNFHLGANISRLYPTYFDLKVVFYFPFLNIYWLLGWVGHKFSIIIVC